MEHIIATVGQTKIKVKTVCTSQKETEQSTILFLDALIFFFKKRMDIHVVVKDSAQQATQALQQDLHEPYCFSSEKQSNAVFGLG